MKSTLCLTLFIFMGVTLQAQNISIDKKLGADNAILVEQEMGLYQHDSLYRLINSVGNKLVSRLKSNPFQFQFFLVDSPEPNAFALPGGYIYVTRGILPLINTEDELAGIMAHEIIHVMQRHSVKQLKKSSLTRLLTVPGKLLNALTGTHIGNAINAPIKFTTKLVISNYSRGHESEADKFGIQLAASAGYKTDALADALVRLTQEIEIESGETEKRSYFSDHPFTPKRVSKIRSTASLYQPVNPSPLYKTKEEFLKNFEGLCYGVNPAQGVFSENTFLHPDMRFAWHAPKDWYTINKPTLVAAYEKEGKALVAMRFDDSQNSVHDIGEETRKKSSESKYLTILQAGDTIINSLPAYIIRMKGSDQDQQMFSELIWINYRNGVVQLAGAGDWYMDQIIHQSLCSFRTADINELEPIKLFQLQIAKANESETIEKLSNRVENQLSATSTAIINDLASEDKLKKSELIKVVKVSPYINR